MLHYTHGKTIDNYFKYGPYCILSVNFNENISTTQKYPKCN